MERLSCMPLAISLDPGVESRVQASAMNTHHQRLRLSDLPLIVRVGVAFALFDTWVIFEEGVVDRTGLWRFLPGYVRARFCPWDLAVLGLALVPLVVLAGRGRRSNAT
jgi:hypothetical protein